MSSRIAIPLHGGPTACQAEGGTIYETVRFNFFCFFKVEILEAFTGFETANKYKVSETFVCVPIVLSQNIIWTFFQVLNSVGQEVYKAKEDTDCCTRQVKKSKPICQKNYFDHHCTKVFTAQCCGPTRPFDMNITDNTGMEVVIIINHHRQSSSWSVTIPILPSGDSSKR